jgi:tetratricopeptide (TPR) repeat protein
LDGLPLALATAGAYLYQVAIGLSDYFRLYKESWAKLQESSPGLTSYEDRTLCSTWQLSLNNIKQRNGLSAKLLCLWAYFDNQDLWFELLRHSDSEDPDWIQELAKDELSFHSAARVLTDHGLAEVDMSSQELVESRGYSIHGCVHSWTIHVLNQEWNYDLARAAVKLVASHIPKQDAVQPRLKQQRLLQHAARCSYIVLNDLATDEGMALAWAYHNFGRFYADQGKLAEAEEMLQRALQGREKALGAEHTSTLTTVNCLGNLYIDQGKFTEAEEMLQRALRSYERALGAEHVDAYYGQLLRKPLYRPRQAGRGRGDAPAGTTREGEGAWS